MRQDGVRSRRGNFECKLWLMCTAEHGAHPPISESVSGPFRTRFHGLQGQCSELELWLKKDGMEKKADLLG